MADTPANTPNDDTLDPERRDLLRALADQRGLLRRTTAALTDAQAAHRSTVSALTVGGIIKHVTRAEAGWVRFIEEGTGAFGAWDEATVTAHAGSFEMAEGETLAGLLDAYEAVAAHTEAVVRALPSLDADHPLPERPWFEPGARWTARRALLHVLTETAQHAGHADIVREAIDGSKSMG